MPQLCFQSKALFGRTCTVLAELRSHNAAFVSLFSQRYVFPVFLVSLEAKVQQRLPLS